MPYSATEDSAIDTEAIESLLGRGERKQAAELLSAHHPADVAAFMLRLDNEDARNLFSLLEPKLASEVITELSDEVKNKMRNSLEEGARR